MTFPGHHVLPALLAVILLISPGTAPWAALPEEHVPHALPVTEAGGSIKALLSRAEGGEREAQYLLGLHYQLGRRTAVDFAAARRWFAMAANGGHAAAQDSLGVMHVLADARRVGHVDLTDDEECSGGVGVQTLTFSPFSRATYWSWIQA